MGRPTKPSLTRIERIDVALDLISDYGEIDGAHHKQWVLDQVVRALCEDSDAYSAWVVARGGTWDKGIAP